MAGGVPELRLTFAYDAQSRRIRKVVEAKVGGVWQTKSDARFVYDGWNLIAEVEYLGTAADAPPSTGATPSPFLRRTYMWGLDMSGTMTGAGGVSGLLAITRHEHGAVPAKDYWVTWDLNGNVIGLVNQSGLRALYEYDPFGKPLRVSEPEEGLNPFGFSTKYTDAETGLVYYGYRYYDAGKGRWINRDPIEERGGLNLYGMVGNEPTNKWDLLGLDYHHWFAQQGDRDAQGVAPGQYAIWNKFPKLSCFDIDDYTTWLDGFNVQDNWSGTPHQFLHGKTIKYSTIYAAVFAESQNECQFLVSMKFLMEACHILLRIKQDFGGGYARGSKYSSSTLQLVRYQNSRISTNQKYLNKIVEVCSSREQLPIPAVARYYSDVKDLEAQFNTVGLGVPTGQTMPIYNPNYTPGEGPLLYMAAVGAVAAGVIVIGNNATGIGVADDVPALTALMKVIKELFSTSSGVPVLP